MPLYHLYNFHSPLQGNPKVEEEPPKNLTKFSETVPNTSNQVLGHRQKTEAATAMVNLQHRLSRGHQKKRNKDLIYVDWEIDLYIMTDCDVSVYIAMYWINSVTGDGCVLYYSHDSFTQICGLQYVNEGLILSECKCTLGKMPQEYVWLR